MKRSRWVFYPVANRLHEELDSMVRKAEESKEANKKLEKHLAKERSNTPKSKEIIHEIPKEIELPETTHEEHKMEMEGPAQLGYGEVVAEPVDVNAPVAKPFKRPKKRLISHLKKYSKNPDGTRGKLLTKRRLGKEARKVRKFAKEKKKIDELTKKIRTTAAAKRTKAMATTIKKAKRAKQRPIGPVRKVEKVIHVKGFHVPAKEYKVKGYDRKFTVRVRSGIHQKKLFKLGYKPL